MLVPEGVRIVSRSCLLRSTDHLLVITQQLQRIGHAAMHFDDLCKLTKSNATRLVTAGQVSNTYVTHLIKCDESLRPKSRLYILDMESKAALEHHEIIDNTETDIKYLNRKPCMVSWISFGFGADGMLSETMKMDRECLW